MTQIPAKCDRHGVDGCSRCVVVTDAGRRMSDRINLTVVARGWDELQNGFMAFRLDDGSSNGTLYDSYEQAVRFTDESRHAYFCFRQAMGGANPKDCEIFLAFNRYAVEAGIPRKIPESRRERMISPILSIYGYDVMSGRSDPK
jgi:hypothetical protein